MVTVYDRDERPHVMIEANALDMVLHKGWHLPPQGADNQTASIVCPACKGKGVTSDDDACWHCDGEGIDPCS